MALALKVDLTVQTAPDADATFEKSSSGPIEISELVTSLDHQIVDEGTLNAGETNRSVALLPITSVKFLLIEAENDIQITLGGGAATGAAIEGSGGTYNTGFTGGETLNVDIDGVTLNVVFDVADQSLQQVINRINSVAALAGFAVGVASNNGSGQLRLASPTTGSSSIVDITSGTALVTLGLTVSTSTGLDATPGSSPITLRRLGDASSSADLSGLKAYALMTVVTGSLSITNLSATEKVGYRMLLVGDYTVDSC